MIGIISFEQRVEELQKVSNEELIKRASNIQLLHHRRNYRDWSITKIIKFIATIEDSFEKAFSGDYPENHEGI